MMVRNVLREREREIFKVKRNYEDFIERLGIERNNNNNEYLPYSETEIAVDLSLIHI